MVKACFALRTIGSVSNRYQSIWCLAHVAPVQAGGAGFAHTGSSLRTLEAVAAAVAQQEGVLLVGETGTGKTTLLQHLADLVAL
jgi:midasin (ATPase involved in ribosome maturation)